ncbi:type II toxin-antitoxin system RelE/ParE family toxin [Flavobacterium sp. 3HN19-14]|uniref:type II toxin-antitoxin system RelE/ParE family toxin n=1 Tax=Flavobacterium sp. 3HN19-14 TaxID=3448133 RepID=UPI003EDFABFC
MAKYKFTRRALNDLIEIWDYTVETWSENQAEKYYNLIIASCMDLSDNPKLGKSYEILSLNVLGYKCGEHIIFYREISKNEIEIERVLHGMMDLKSKL